MIFGNFQLKSLKMKSRIFLVLEHLELMLETNSLKKILLDASPVHNISKGSPPTIILTGTKDKIVPVETIMNYKKIMESVGSRCDVILYDGAEHSFFNIGEDFIDTVLKSDIFLKSNWYLEGKPTIKQQY